MGETESTRYAWVRELDTQSEDAEVKLVAFLGDPSWRVRQEAVNAIGKYGVTQSLVERLIQAMASGHSAGLRNAASEALVLLGEPVVEPLLSSLASADSSQRKFIVDALGLVGSQASKAGFLRQSMTVMIMLPPRRSKRWGASEEKTSYVSLAASFVKSRAKANLKVICLIHSASARLSLIINSW